MTHAEAVETLDNLTMILSVFPADTSVEKENLETWKRAVALGKKALQDLPQFAQFVADFSNDPAVRNEAKRHGAN
jgi:hypothetical protein